MPRGDRTGPLGEGPMTGLRRGDCADGTTNFGTRGGFGGRLGFGRGRGFGFGRGMGWRWSDENRNISEESSLKSSISLLKEQLQNLENRLKKLKGDD